MAQKIITHTASQRSSQYLPIFMPLSIQPQLTRCSRLEEVEDDSCWDDAVDDGEVVENGLDILQAYDDHEEDHEEDREVGHGHEADDETWEAACSLREVDGRVTYLLRGQKGKMALNMTKDYSSEVSNFTTEVMHESQ